MRYHNARLANAASARMRNAFAAFALLAAAFHAQPVVAQTVLDNSFPTDLPVTMAEMHAAVAQSFYDPASTRYRRLVVVDRQVADYVICGWLSSRNSRGLYTAFCPFGFNVRNHSVYIGVNYLSPALGSRSRLALADFGCPAEALGL